MLSVRDAVYKSFKAKSQRAIRLHLCESIFIIFAPSYVNSSRQNRFKCCNLHDLIYVFLDNGVMNTPKRRFLSFAFTVLCFKKSLLIRTRYWCGNKYMNGARHSCVIFLNDQEVKLTIIIIMTLLLN